MTHASTPVSSAPAPVVLMLDEGIHDLSGLLDALYERMKPWASLNGYRTFTNAFVLGAAQDLNLHTYLLRMGGLPTGWTVYGTIPVRDTRYLLVRTGEGWWALLAVENTFSMAGTTVRPVVCERSLGMLADHILGTHLTSPLMQECLMTLLSQCPLREGEEPEQMLAALGGGVYVPWSAYSA